MYIQPETRVINVRVLFYQLSKKVFFLFFCEIEGIVIFYNYFLVLCSCSESRDQMADISVD